MNDVRIPFPATTEMGRPPHIISLASAVILHLSLHLALLHSPCSDVEASLSPPSPAFVKRVPTASPQFPNRTLSRTTSDLSVASPPRPSTSERRTARFSAAGNESSREDGHIGRGGGDAGLHVSATGADKPTASTSTIPAVPAKKSIDLSAEGSDQDQDEKKPPNLGAYWEILRPHNIPASFGLVAAGALVASHSPSSLLDGKVGADNLLYLSSLVCHVFPHSKIILLLSLTSPVLPHNKRNMGPNSSSSTAGGRTNTTVCRTRAPLRGRLTPPVTLAQGRLTPCTTATGNYN